MKKSADRKLLLLDWEGPGYDDRANYRPYNEHIF